MIVLLTLTFVPKRKLGRFLPYFYRAWKRGKATAIPAAAPWEDLLPLQLAEVQERFSIAPSAQVHPHGIWKGDMDGLDWAPAPVAG